jgi:50S ribosomal subunit-associated GTPase HflX
MDSNQDGDVDLLDFAVLQLQFTGRRAFAALPSKHIGFDLIGIPRILVFNKSDRGAPGSVEALAAQRGGVAISALGHHGLPELLARCDRILWAEGATARATAAGADVVP